MTAAYEVCPVLWCEREHLKRKNRVQHSHSAVLDRKQWFRATEKEIAVTRLSASLWWQESAELGPYVAIDATGGNSGGRLAILPIGVATSLADLMARDMDAYGEGGRFLVESIRLATDILA